MVGFRRIRSMLSEVGQAGDSVDKTSDVVRAFVLDVWQLFNDWREQGHLDLQVQVSIVSIKITIDLPPRGDSERELDADEE